MQDITNILDNPLDNTLVISLASRKDRQNTLATRLFYGGITNFNQIEAIQPNSKEVKELENWVFDNRLKNIRKNESRKACYLSHLKALEQAGDRPCLILEDDIIFKKPNLIKEVIDMIPNDAFSVFFDNTLLEYCSNKHTPMCSEGYHKINPKEFRVWCLGCTYYKDPKQVLDILNKKEKKKVIDKMIIDEIQANYPCYVYMGACKQDRKTFGSDIC